MKRYYLKVFGVIFLAPFLIVSNGFGSAVGIATTGYDEINPEVIYNSSEDEYLVLWERNLSTTDHDIVARRFTGEGFRSQVVF